jgi:hypothetical protein
LRGATACVSASVEMSQAMSAIEPTFRVARIVYFADLTKVGSRVIPLGAFAEVTLPHVHGLALKARASLKPVELSMISALLRDRITNPFAFLKSEFDLAWKSVEAGVRALDFLAGRHASSLSVLAPKNYSERTWLLQRLIPARNEAVEGKLSAAVDSEFSELLKFYGMPDPVAPDRKVIESSRDAA